MITTLIPHLRIGPYKEGVTIVQIQTPFNPIMPVIQFSRDYETLMTLYVLKLQLLNSTGTTPCTRCYLRLTLFLRSRVWGTRLKRTCVRTYVQEITKDMRGLRSKVR